MINWQAFHFLRPEWLVALIPLALLLIAMRYLHKQQSGWQSVLASHLYQHLVTSKGSAGSKPPLWLLALGWLTGVLALAGPTWEQLPQPVYQLNTGKVVVLDMSLSMRATDIAPDRLTRAKFKTIDLVKAISEGETGLVAYSGDAFTVSPLSTDAQNLTTLIPSLSPEIMPLPGSEPYYGLESANNLLQNAGFKQGEIFWITDGVEISQLAELKQLIADSPYRVSILAVGTADGAPIRQANGDLLKDARGAIVIPQMDADPLQGLARIGGGRFVTLQADDSDIDYLLGQSLVERDAEEHEEELQTQGDEWKEMGPYLLLLLLPLAAYGFRRGLIAVVVAGILLPLTAPPAQASWWDDLWKTRDQQGMDRFNQDDYAAAADAFNDPLWQGSAHYRNGDFEAALQSFSQSDSTDALYNKGNALAQLGELDEAIAAYEEVLQRAPDHEDARANKELLEQQKQQQQQQDQQNSEDQQQQDQQNSDQQQQDQQDSSQSDSQQNDQQQGQQGDQEQQQNDADQQEQQSDGEQQEQDQQAEQEQQQQQSEQEQQQQADQQQQQSQQAEAEMTDEQKEEMQRLQNLLRKVPDDPAFLLKRKMQLEHQQRRRERNTSRNTTKW